MTPGQEDKYADMCAGSTSSPISQVGLIPPSPEVSLAPPQAAVQELLLSTGVDTGMKSVCYPLGLEGQTSLVNRAALDHGRPSDHLTDGSACLPGLQWEQEGEGGIKSPELPLLKGVETTVLCRPEDRDTEGQARPACSG